MNPSVRKQVLRSLTNGVYILTLGTPPDIHGLTLTWLSQASFEPPLVMFAVHRERKGWKLLAQHQFFVIHILKQEQKAIAQAFFKDPEKTDTSLGGIPFETGKTGVPILKTLPAWLEGSMRASVHLGDHVVVVGEVLEVGYREEFVPLALRDTPWHYGG